MSEIHNTVNYVGPIDVAERFKLVDVFNELNLTLHTSALITDIDSESKNLLVIGINKDNAIAEKSEIEDLLTNTASLYTILIAGDKVGDEQLILLKKSNSLTIPSNTTITLLRSMISFYLCASEKTSTLETQLQQATQAAFSAMMANAQMGQVAQFFEHAFRCTEYATLGEKIADTLSNLGLDGDIVFWGSSLNFDNIEEENVEQRMARRHFIKEHAGQDRFVETDKGLIICDKSIAILLKNMPPVESDQHGQLRDTLATLIEGCQFCIRTIRSQKAAHQAEQAKITFLSILSHELKTPMNAIMGFSKLLTRHQEGDTFSKRDLGGIAAIDENAQRLLSLIEDMLALSEINELQTELSRFDIRNALFSIFNNYKERASAKQLDFEIEEVNCDEIIYSDVKRLKVMMKCLLSNAIKFTEQGGIHVRIEVFNNDYGKQLVISVADTGIGISPENHIKLYTPFTQLSEGLSRKSEGAGLGLSVVRQFLEQLGGDITVNSQPDKGSVFTFRLPVSLETKSQ